MLPGETEWNSVLGNSGTLNTFLTYNLTSSELDPASYVQAKYRCQNAIGLGEWSPVDYLLMAGVPEAPPKPSYISSTDTTITVQLYETQNSNGSPITGYELWRDEGDDTSDLTVQETNYDGVSTDYQLTGLTPGVIYKIATLAVNNEGKSVLGEYVLIVASELPSPTGGIYKVTEQSSKTKLTIRWDASVDPSSPVTGYIL